LPAAFFGWRAFFAVLAFLAAERLPFGCGALASGVLSVSIVFVFIRVSPGPGCGRHNHHSGSEELQAKLLAIAARNRSTRVIELEQLAAWCSF
jgi:hypothetical protein